MSASLIFRSRSIGVEVALDGRTFRFQWAASATDPHFGDLSRYDQGTARCSFAA